MGQKALQRSVRTLVKCGKGLGCDISTLTCVSPCGAPGEACYDGPETRALGWRGLGDVYSLTGLGLIDMCAQGTCDQPTHRCVACSSAPGTACCPPDASQATARCIGINLDCKFEDGSQGTRGTCFYCGGISNPPCGRECEYPLKLNNSVCVLCGGIDEVACDDPFSESWCNKG